MERSSFEEAPLPLIYYARQQSTKRSSPQMPAAAHSSIPPPGPPSRPGVLKFLPSSPLNNASAASSSSAATASAAASRFSPAYHGHKTVANVPPTSAAASAKLAGRCSRSAAPADARATSSGASSGRARGEGELGHGSNAPMTQRPLEGLPVPPPSRFKRFTSFLWSSKRERRKSGENKKSEKEKPNNQSVSKERTKSPLSAHQSPEFIAGNYGSPSVGARNAWGSPTRQTDETAAAAAANKPDRGPWNRDARTRKSFRFSGHITDSGADRNVLPLWLEETSGARQSGQNFNSNRSEVGSSDASFESRWDSLNGGNKKQTQVFTVRPPGWEDVDQHVRPKRKKPVKKNPSFCPSFTINDASKCSLEPKASADIRPLSPPRTASTEVPRVTTIGPVSNNNIHDAFNMTELSANVDSVTMGSFLQEKVQFSMSNLAPHSASNSPTRTPSQSSTSGITDRHLWASTDSFICEDFSFCKGVPPNKPQEERLSQHSPPRSFSQVLLHPQNMNEQHLTGHDDLYEDLDGESSFKTSFDRICLETEGASYSSIHTANSNNNVIGFEASCHLDAGNITEGDSSFSAASNCIASQIEPTCQEVSCSPYGIKEDSTRDNWIRFDCESLNNLAGSSTGVSYDSAGSTISKTDDIDFVHQSNFDMYDGNPSEPVTSPTSPVLHRHFSGSTLNLVEPRLHQTPEIYKGQLVRHYSIRGKRAGKRVTRTVSQKMKPPEYGKLTEPVAPRFSKAALTMVSGPGLFEQNTLPIDKTVDTEEDAQVEETETEQILELPTLTEGSSDFNQTNNSTLSPGLPNRAGSLRVPRLPSIFLRRSVSLNAPKVSRGEVPFQRLPERKGSFRKAMGAIARSFRRRPGERVQGNELSSHIAERASGSAIPPRLHRSGSTGSSFRQTPKAPRLPRRTISHKQISPNEPK